MVSPHKGAHVNVKLTDFGTSRCDAMYNKPSFDLSKTRSGSIPNIAPYNSGTMVRYPKLKNFENFQKKRK